MNERAPRFPSNIPIIPADRSHRVCVCVPFHHNRITGQSFLSSLTFSKFYNREKESSMRKKVGHQTRERNIYTLQSANKEREVF